MGVNVRMNKLPDRWKLEKLGNIASFINGKAFKPSDWKTSGLPIVRIQNLTAGSSETNYFQGECEQKYFIQNGDILISWSATLGVYEWQGGDAVLNQHIFKVVFDKQEIDKTFFKYLINKTIQDMLKHIHGSTMKHITKADFDKIPIILPPLETQKQIAAVLDKADEIRQKRKLANQKLDELLQSTFIDMFGDPVTNPKGWNSCKIIEVCNVQTGSTPSRDKPEYYGGSIPWVKTGEVVNTYIYDTEEHITQEAINKSNCKLFPQNTILVAMYGQGYTRGRVAVLKKQATTNQACSAILPSTKINHEFLFNLLKSQYNTLRELGRGGNQPNLNLSMVKDFRIFTPPLDLQSKFAQIVEKVEEQKSKNEAQIKKLDDLFNSLLQRAFKDELEFKELVHG